jgi:hypothetical protein
MNTIGGPTKIRKIRAYKLSEITLLTDIDGKATSIILSIPKSVKSFLFVTDVR